MKGELAIDLELAESTQLRRPQIPAALCGRRCLGHNGGALALGGSRSG
jgi:hypothetical protein